MARWHWLLSITLLCNTNPGKFCPICSLLHKIKHKLTMNISCIQFFYLTSCTATCKRVKVYDRTRNIKELQPNSYDELLPSLINVSDIEESLRPLDFAFNHYTDVSEEIVVSDKVKSLMARDRDSDDDQKSMSRTDVFVYEDDLRDLHASLSTSSHIANRDLIHFHGDVQRGKTIP